MQETESEESLKGIDDDPPLGVVARHRICPVCLSLIAQGQGHVCQGGCDHLVKTLPEPGSGIGPDSPPCSYKRITPCQLCFPAQRHHHQSPNDNSRRSASSSPENPAPNQPITPPSGPSDPPGAIPIPNPPPVTNSKKAHKRRKSREDVDALLSSDFSDDPAILDKALDGFYAGSKLDEYKASFSKAGVAPVLVKVLHSPLLLDDTDALLDALESLENLTRGSAANKTALAQAGVAEPLLAILQEPVTIDENDVAAHAYSAFANLAGNREGQVAFFRAGVVKWLVHVLSRSSYLDKANVAEPFFRALSNLGTSTAVDLAGAFVAARGAPLHVRYLKSLSPNGHTGTIQQCMAAVAAIAGPVPHKQAYLQAGVVPVLVSLLKSPTVFLAPKCLLQALCALSAFGRAGAVSALEDLLGYAVVMAGEGGQLAAKALAGLLNLANEPANGHFFDRSDLTSPLCKLLDHGTVQTCPDASMALLRALKFFVSADSALPRLKAALVSAGFIQGSFLSIFVPHEICFVVLKLLRSHVLANDSKNNTNSPPNRRRAIYAKVLTMSSVRASHLLVKHSGSRRPSSWREARITRSKEEAIRILQGYRDQIVSGQARFEDLARQFSDCSSARNNGDLGVFGRGQMQKPFEDTAFGLQVGQLSGIIETESGVHIVLRTA
ncbi:putative Peptidyl-prolyl cis-trans isomerase NIMA-interacting [Paratrimastix pyriformis]|uniref:peptidylprolyl isomerase n=1 Tax=Paratrimastix pyriformis TaxID=342808 RepID=A0ABQ8USW5_9EUKA|nr:putative Peptidyl-prolyl cis-trans isomerase NIMA-interacting [Paratrimastix pyriformis]